MEQDKLNSDLNSLERKLKLLIMEYQNLKRETSELRRENEELRELVNQKDNQINNFQNKFKISKIVDYLNAGENNVPELKQQIDDYIKEIDKCILHLSK